MENPKNIVCSKSQEKINLRKTFTFHNGYLIWSFFIVPETIHNNKELQRNIHNNAVFLCASYAAKKIAIFLQ